MAAGPAADAVPGSGEAPQDTDPADSKPPFPWSRCLLLYSIIASTAIALSGPVVFLPDMAQLQFGMSEDDAGNAVGLLVGMFSAGQFLSSFFLGYLSDRFGRRPLLLVGVASSFTLLCLFGFSPSLWVAVGNRFLEGLTNGNIPVGKAYLSNLSAHPEHRALMFSYLGVSFSLARLVSPSIAGLIAGLLPDDSDLKFALPCFVLGFPLLLVFIVTWFKLPEVAPAVLRARARAAQARAAGAQSRAAAGARARVAAPATATAPFLVRLATGLRRVLADPVMRRLILIYGIDSFGNGTIIVLFILLLSLDSAKGGAGLSSSAVGAAVAIFGGTAILFQLLLFKRILARLGVRRVFWYVGSLTLGVGTLVFPFAGIVLGGSSDPAPALRALSWVVIVAASTMLGVGFIALLPMMHTMLANASIPAIQGLSQGTAQSFAAMLRSLGPIVSGFAFSAATKAGAPWLVFAGVSAVYLGAMSFSFGLPESVESERGKPVVTAATAAPGRDVEGGEEMKSADGKGGEDDGEGEGDNERAVAGADLDEAVVVECITESAYAIVNQDQGDQEEGGGVELVESAGGGVEDEQAAEEGEDDEEEREGERVARSYPATSPTTPAGVRLLPTAAVSSHGKHGKRR